jgi:hypothetical protein
MSCPPSLQSISVDQIYKNIVGGIWRITCINVLPPGLRQQFINRITEGIRHRGVSQAVLTGLPYHAKHTILMKAYNNNLHMQKLDEALDFPSKRKQIFGDYGDELSCIFKIIMRVINDPDDANVNSEQNRNLGSYLRSREDTDSWNSLKIQKLKAIRYWALSSSHISPAAHAKLQEILSLR